MLVTKLSLINIPIVKKKLQPDFQHHFQHYKSIPIWSHFLRTKVKTITSILGHSACTLHGVLISNKRTILTPFSLTSWKLSLYWRTVPACGNQLFIKDALILWMSLTCIQNGLLSLCWVDNAPFVRAVIGSFHHSSHCQAHNNSHAEWVQNGCRMYV